MANVADWVSENCTTVGTGAAIVSGPADTSQARFRDTIPAGEVWYSIVDGSSREVGIGVFNGTTQITRSDVYATLVNGIYDESTPTPISLSGTAIVECTLNAEAFDIVFADIAQLRVDVDKNTADILLLDSGNSILEPRVAQNEADIAVLQSDVVTNTSDISTLQSDYTILDNDVSYRESAVTALETGGGMTQNGNTVVTIAAGRGEIIDSYTDTENQNTEEVTWTETNFDLLANAGMPVVSGAGFTHIGIGSGGVVAAFPGGMSSAQRRVYIRIGTVEYTDQVITTITLNPIVSNQIGNILLDYIDFVDSNSKMQGLTLRPTEIGDLSVWRDTGIFFGPGANYAAAKDDQNLLPIAARGAVDAALPFSTVTFNNGTSGVGAEITSVPADAYEELGLGVVDTLPNGTAVIHYLFQTIGGTFFMSYGQQTYADFTTATSNLFADNASHKFPAETGNMIKLGQMVIFKGQATWLTGAAEIFPTGQSSSSSSSGGTAGNAIDVAYTDSYSLGTNVQVALDSLGALKLSTDQHAAVNAAAAPSAGNAFATVADVAGASTHNSLTGLQGGTASQYYHLTLAERDKLTGIEAGATTDQTKADIDALGIDAETIDGLDSTAFLQNVVQDTTPQLGGYLDCNGKTFNASSYRQAVDLSTASAATLDYSLEDMRQVTLTGNGSITYSNFIPGQVCGYILDAVNFGAHTVTWPVGTLFAAGVSPTFTAAGMDRILILKDKDNAYTVHIVDQDIK